MKPQRSGQSARQRQEAADQQPHRRAESVQVEGTFRTDKNGEIDLDELHISICVGLDYEHTISTWADIWDSMPKSTRREHKNSVFTFTVRSEHPLPADASREAIVERAIRAKLHETALGRESVAVLVDFRPSSGKVPVVSPEKLEPPPLQDVIEEMKDGLAEVRAVYREKLESLLKKMEGQRFKSSEEGLAAVRLLRAWAGVAGRQLLFDGKPVAIRLALGSRQRSPTIQGVMCQSGKQIHVFSSPTFPALTSRSTPDE